MPYGDIRARDLGQDIFYARLADTGIGIRIGPFNAHIRARAAALDGILYELYADYPLLTEPAVHHFNVRLEDRRPWSRRLRSMVRFSVDGRRPHEDMPAAHALPVLEWGLNLVIALRSHCFLMLHAAVLEKEGRALVMPAAPGYGKTTLCAALAHHGWRLLSDEFGLMRPGGSGLIAVPRPMALKNESIDIIRRFAPDAMIGPSIANTRKGTVAHVKPPADSAAHVDEPAEPALIVFPRWQAAASLQQTEVSKAQGFMLLAMNAFNYELLGEAGFAAVRNLVDASRCFQLTYSDLDAAVRWVDELT